MYKYEFKNSLIAGDKISKSSHEFLSKGEYKQYFLLQTKLYFLPLIWMFEKDKIKDELGMS